MIADEKSIITEMKPECCPSAKARDDNDAQDKRYFLSKSVKKASLRLLNSSAVRRILSPIFIFTTDRSGIYLITLLPRKTPLLFIKDSHINSTSFRGLPSLPVTMRSLCT